MRDMDDQTSRANLKGQSDNRRHRGLRAISTALPALKHHLLGGRSVELGGLMADWSAIVGAETAARSLPRKIYFPRTGCRLDATLLVRVEPGWALEMQHKEPLLIERINGYFGYRAITRLRLQQGPVSRRGAAIGPAARALSREEKRQVRRQVSRVRDEALRAALEGLGRALRRHTST